MMYDVYLCDFFILVQVLKFEPQHDKTNKIPVHPGKTQDQPGHPPSLISLPCLLEETLGP